MTQTDSTCTTAFGCCIANDDKSVSVCNSETEDAATAVAAASTAATTTVNVDFVAGNNNNSLCINNAYEAMPPNRQVFSFPRRTAVDLEFQNVRYTVGCLSLTQRKYGIYKVKLHTSIYERNIRAIIIIINAGCVIEKRIID